MAWVMGMVALMALGLVLAVWLDARQAVEERQTLRLIPARVLVEHRRRHTLR